MYFLISRDEKKNGSSPRSKDEKASWVQYKWWLRLSMHYKHTRFTGKKHMKCQCIRIWWVILISAEPIRTHTHQRTEKTLTHIRAHEYLYPRVGIFITCYLCVVQSWLLHVISERQPDSPVTYIGLPICNTQIVANIHIWFYFISIKSLCNKFHYHSIYSNSYNVCVCKGDFNAMSTKNSVDNLSTTALHIVLLE